MPSKLKSDTARTNGAKSHGPVTPEGRAKSSANSVRHGLTAKSVVLPHESTEDFQLLLDGYVAQFRPQTEVEIELVETMAIARWRLRRIVAIEANLFNTEMLRRAEEIDNEFSDIDGDGRLARVFRNLAQGQSLALIIRYEGTLNRSYDRAFKQLQLLQSVRNPPQPNEPKPTPAPATSTPADSSNTTQTQANAETISPSLTTASEPRPCFAGNCDIVDSIGPL
jgi:hypothetical protein